MNLKNEAVNYSFNSSIGQRSEIVRQVNFQFIPERAEREEVDNNADESANQNQVKFIK